MRASPARGGRRRRRGSTPGPAPTLARTRHSSPATSWRSLADTADVARWRCATRVATARPEIGRWAWAEIDLEALDHNVRTICAQRSAPAELWAVVKADGYGHGAVAVAAQAPRCRGRRAVRRARPGRSRAPRGRHRCTDPRAQRAAAGPVRRRCSPHGLTPTVYTDGVRRRARRGGRARRGDAPCDVHVKVDTGMQRVGADPADAAALLAHVRRARADAASWPACTPTSPAPTSPHRPVDCRAAGHVRRRARRARTSAASTAAACTPPTRRRRSPIPRAAFDHGARRHRDVRHLAGPRRRPPRRRPATGDEPEGAVSHVKRVAAGSARLVRMAAPLRPRHHRRHRPDRVRRRRAATARHARPTRPAPTC